MLYDVSNRFKGKVRKEELLCILRFSYNENRLLICCCKSFKVHLPQFLSGSFLYILIQIVYYKSHVSQHLGQTNFFGEMSDFKRL